MYKSHIAIQNRSPRTQRPPFQKGSLTNPKRWRTRFEQPYRRNRRTGYRRFETMQTSDRFDQPNQPAPASSGRITDRGDPVHRSRTDRSLDGARAGIRPSLRRDSTLGHETGSTERSVGIGDRRIQYRNIRFIHSGTESSIRHTATGFRRLTDPTTDGTSAHRSIAEDDGREPCFPRDSHARGFEAGRDSRERSVGTVALRTDDSRSTGTGLETDATPAIGRVRSVPGLHRRCTQVPNPGNGSTRRRGITPRRARARLRHPRSWRFRSIEAHERRTAGPDGSR